MDSISRKTFLKTLSLLSIGTMVNLPTDAFGLNRKLRVVLVGTGIRGITFWGRRLVEQFPETLEFVGLSDINPGRLKYAKEYMRVSCPTFVNYDEMLRKTKPDLIIVCTTDASHHELIIKGLAYCDVLTEKPLTIDEVKAQAIIDAEKKYGKNVIVGFNYRWSPYMTKIKQLISEGAIGEVTSVDFNWYLNTHHGASYFRRWHGLMNKGGSLWIHKATHHFDLLNWWLSAEPEEVFAYGALEHYGKNGPFRGKNCRSCDHKKDCAYYWDITKDKQAMNLYVANENYDGYLRDGCVYRNEIDIYDKMSAQIKYKNGVIANYSLTTYSPYEGWRIAFNGQKGRIDAWLDIPFINGESLSQEELHAAEMQQAKSDTTESQLILFRNWEKYEVVTVSSERSGHGGGDRRLQEDLFLKKSAEDPYDHRANLRDGVLSVLIGVAARKSIEAGKPIQIGSLTDLKPEIKKS